MAAACPELSIIIPTRNRGALIQRTLASILSQRINQFGVEVIVVDNGSSDSTAEIIRTAAVEQPDRVRYAHDGRIGVSNARNTGIALARAPLVAFCDDDQEVAPDWATVIRRTFMEHPEVDAIGGMTLPMWSSPPPPWLTGRELSGPVSAIHGGSRAFHVSRSRWFCLGAGNMAMRRQALDALGGFDPDYPRSQDRELLVRLLLSGRQAFYEPSMIVYHTVDGSRVNHTAFRRWFTTEGRMRAGYAFDELFLSGDEMRPLPPDAPRLLGVAPALYRRLLRESADALAARLRGRRHQAFVHELRVLYTWSYIRRRQEIAFVGRMRLRTVLGDVLDFARAKVRSRRSPVRVTSSPRGPASKTESV